MPLIFPGASPRWSEAGQQLEIRSPLVASDSGRRGRTTWDRRVESGWCSRHRAGGTGRLEREAYFAGLKGREE